MLANRRDDDEFTQYAAARRGYLRRTAYLLCGDWDDADDLVQTALAKLYVAWPRIRRAGTPDAYARRVIVRASIDESRRPWRREQATDRLPDRPAVPGLAIEDREHLRDVLARLPARQRAVIVLRYWGGLSVEEAAADLGCSAGTIKSQTARAMARIRQAFNPNEITHEGGR